MGKSNKLRHPVQFLFTIATNGYFKGFLEGNIYKGSSKSICVPGLNCYSCPGALGACPIGSMQAVIGSIRYDFSLYILGIISAFGILLGRFICGWLCPFGMVQDLLHKIPFLKYKVPKKINNIFKYLKYVILIVFVILLPFLFQDELGISDPFFCKYICPSGTLMGGIPLVLTNESLKSAIGFLFAWKMAILIIVILTSIIIFRPFCRYICPLGAFYSLMNPISFYKLKIKEDKCTRCGVCTKSCKLNIEVYKKPNTGECIRCGDCVKACPRKAIKSGMSYRDTM
ncbi:4Fe-4S dicluster domain protein [Clostridium argentinense CDC 2741]|uniref:4Fe-4S dicluster domain protein n=1 Tax=Clostridium argentinense CDC 2741 TaxID=1418104 RepID=A0A0C1R1L5_9CLOT|nr:4Fe-4S binding protein [Clostridium argentinense]ARC84069.1 4Fe-4S ferredoxin [Clostridium argentinense]KIE44346.1 4Fe-4S dicluster domain protein [Clostridium argentinense CDC 2741]NFF39326.1 4Fe-4S binding protein [Clostridium argentinense]NFP51431.1 4Fe-4S binding protein [Clostridium argentinense]NFP74643.1 4Fe-4S binding protein [Clostridium argentinense]